MLVLFRQRVWQAAAVPCSYPFLVGLAQPEVSHRLLLCSQYVFAASANTSQPSPYQAPLAAFQLGC